MSVETKISWCDATWNPVRGCSRVSEGCRHCYAEQMAARFSYPGAPFHGFAKVVAPRDHLDRVGGRRNGWTGRVELIPERLTIPLSWRRPRRIFVNSMADLFHEQLLFEDIAAVFGAMAACRQHTFLVLTKRPQRLGGFFGWIEENHNPNRFRGPELIEHAACWVGPDSPESDPLFRAAGSGSLRPWPLPNVWIGVSCENQESANERIPLLLRTPAALRFVSVEPMLGPVVLRPPVTFETQGEPRTWLGPDDGTPEHGPGLDWVICGSETGGQARPMLAKWAGNLRDQCQARQVPFFLKQVGRVAERDRELDGRTWEEFPSRERRSQSGA